MDTEPKSEGLEICEFSERNTEAISTSPGQLQDVTMDNSYAIGYRSPCASLQQYTGSTSPGQGRSVREFEEQMAALRKENFNLKLRIYFLEEKVPGYNQMATENQESLMKQCIDAKVEMEVLKKEINEKQDLLVDAAQALTQMENLQKDTERRSNEIIEELNQKIHCLEMEIKNADKTTNAQFMQLMGRSDISGDFDYLQRMRELEGVVKQSEDQILDLSAQIVNLESLVQDKNDAIKEYEDKVKDLVFQNAELIEQLDNKDKQIVSAESQALREELQAHKRQLADKICTLEEIELKLKQKSITHDSACKTIKKLMLTIKSLQDEIDRLKKNNTNTSADLKEVSQMTSSSLGRSLSDTETRGETNWRLTYESLLEKEDEEINNLKAEINKNSSVSKNYNQSHETLEHMKLELQEAKNEAERAEKWRKECSEVCALLTSRLEELAGFLDSLLKHKDVLGVLAADRRRAIRKAVDKSLDLSRSLNNISLSMTGLSIMDHSLTNLSNLSAILDLTAYKDNKTFNSHEDIRSDAKVIEMLQSEVKSLKTELDKRKFADSIVKKERRALPANLAENHSESEAWSEPDRKVSLARIGLDESSNAFALKKDDDKSSDSESDLNHSRSKSKSQEKIKELELMISQRDNRILEIQCELVDADNRLKQESLRVIELTREYDEYKKINELLQMEMASVKLHSNSIQDLKAECETLRQRLAEKSTALEQVQEAHERVTMEAHIAEAKIKALHAEIEDIKSSHEKKEDEYRDQMERKLRECEEEHKAILAQDWIARGVYESLQREHDALQKNLIELQSTIEYFTDNEVELKRHLVENEKTMRSMQKKLDDATMQASKSVLERTKAFNEKLKLESRLQDLEKEVENLHSEKQRLCTKINDLESVSVSLQNQLTNVKTANARGVSQTEYSSDDQPRKRLENSSPDLGIETDVARNSSVDSANNNKNEDLAAEILNIDEETQQSPANKHGNKTHDCTKIEQENAELRRKLIRTKRAFEDVYHKLRIDNQRKEQVERTIKDQILKTHNVLKNVRSNIENELK